jgi:uncharacterized protein YmfQ (DUF2313 family)
MAWRPRDATAFAHALMAKLPLGEIWSRAVGTLLVRTMRALAGVVARWAERVGRFLIYEAFPPSSYDLLPDWERVLGLPEPCVTAPQTLDERRQAVLEKLQRRPGAQSRAYYTNIARRLGYHVDEPSAHALPLELPAEVGRIDQITIREFRPFMFGVSRFGNPTWRFAPPRMRFVWIVTVPGVRLSWFRFGRSRLGQDPHLKINRAEDLECILHKLKPAHTNLFFNYENI